MKKIVVIVILVLNSFALNAQSVVLNKHVKMDTVYLALIQNDTSDMQLVNELNAQFDSIVNVFNLKNTTVKFKVDSLHKENTILLTMGQVRYVDLNLSLLMTGVDLSLLALNIFLWPVLPPIIPFYFVPTTNCNVLVESNSEVLKRNTRFSISPSGYFRKKDVQKLKFKKKFNKEYLSLFKEINRQYERNNRP